MSCQRGNGKRINCCRHWYFHDETFCFPPPLWASLFTLWIVLKCTFKIISKSFQTLGLLLEMLRIPRRRRYNRDAAAAATQACPTPIWLCFIWVPITYLHMYVLCTYHLIRANSNSVRKIIPPRAQSRNCIACRGSILHITYIEPLGIATP
mgnify:CR=1 FL=1